jgi:hypothetical protein
MHALLTGAAAAVLAALASTQSPLTTTFATNNNGNVGGGIYFDLTPQVSITVAALDLDFSSAPGTAGSVEVYTCFGSRVGNQTNLAAWTLVSSGTATAAGPGLPTPVAITPFALAPGTVGVALKAIGLAHAYTNGNGANQSASTLELTIQCGEASNVAFTGGLFTPRVVNCNLYYVTGSGTFATASNYGTGCVHSFTSFYENFPVGAFDLANLTCGLIPNGGGYFVLGGFGTFLPPSAAAIALPLANDSETTVPLAASFPFPGGSTGALTVCSNGFVSVASGNGIGNTPTPSTMLNAPQAAWWCWHDFAPAGPGPAGQVLFEQTGTLAVITWNAVVDAFLTTSSTWQLQFDTASGIVIFAWQAMSSGGNGWLVGYSPAGNSLDPGNRDLSAALASGFTTTANDNVPLALRATSRPVLGSACNLLATAIPPGTPFGGFLFGSTQYDPGIDLSPIGMPGCSRYTDGTVVSIFLPTGASQPLAVSIPAGLPVGVQAFVQAATFSPPLTPLGFIASNGVALTVGSQ